MKFSQWIKKKKRNRLTICRLDTSVIDVHNNIIIMLIRDILLLQRVRFIQPTAVYANKTISIDINVVNRQMLNNLVLYYV